MNFGAPTGFILAALTIGGFPVVAQDREPSETTEAVAREGQQADAGPSQDSQEKQLTPNQRPNPLRDPRDRIFYPGDTEKLKPLGEKLMGNILLDQKEIWTSPFHMHTGDAKWWLGFGAATAALGATDHDSALHPNPSQVSWSNHISNIGTSYTLVPLVAGFYGYGVLRDNPKAREVGVLGTEALLDSLIVVAILKPIAGRNRPDAQTNQANFLMAAHHFLRATRFSHGR